MSVSCECLCCQVEVSATGRSLVQSIPTDRDVSLCVIYKHRTRGVAGPRSAVAPEKGRVIFTKISRNTQHMANHSEGL
jgi:hypothetical protein